MPEFNLIKVDGKPIEKLLAIIHDCLGIYIDPTKTRKMADAKAYEIQVIEGAKTNAAVDRETTEFVQRLENRVKAKEILKQHNLESVVHKTVENLAGKETVSPDPIEKDWLTRFFAITEDVSNNEMQELWAKILAGEIERPNSFSLRTLETLRNLNQYEASIFSSFCEFVFAGKGSGFAYYDFTKDLFLNDYGLTSKEIILLQELNLVSSTARSISIIVFPDEPTILDYADKQIEISSANNGQITFYINACTLTTVGDELFKLSGQSFKLSKSPGHQKYFNGFLKELQEKNINFKVLN